MPWSARRWCSSMLLLGLLSWPERVQAAPAPLSEPSDESLEPVVPHDSCKEQPLDTRFRITLEREARLVDLVRWMSSISCTKFIWSPGVRDGKVTVVAPEPVTIAQARAAFYAALETMGLTVEESGAYLKIVESKDANHRVLPVIGPDDAAPDRDRFVTQLYRPQPGRVSDVVAVIEHLRGERGTVTAVGELVILTDTGSNIRRMLEVIEQVDAPPGEADAIFVEPLRFADPEEVAAVIREVFGSQASASASASSSGKGKAKPKAEVATRAATTAPSASDEPRVSAVTVDARTRTLVISAPRAGYPVVRRLIQRLDVEVPDDSGMLFVLPLRHADPEEIAAVLGSLPTSERKGGAATPSSAAPSSPGPPSAGTAPGGGVSIGGAIHVTADPSTRSLVVMASPHDYLGLKRVVEALDVERRLVYIETYILELSTNHGLGTDVSAHFGKDTADGGVGFLATQPGDVSSAVLDASALSGLAAGVIGPSVGDLFGTGVDIPSFGVVIQALETHQDVNIVSDPHLYTADNKTARMEVGQRIPVPTGTNTFGTAGVPVTQTSYTREDVALKLEVTPHLGEGGALTLDLLIENQEVVDADGEGGPTTTKRMLELEDVVAHDGQPVVLGGLVQEKEQIVKRQIPGLGSIPVLGWLFKKRTHTRTKVNLLVVMVPHVLDSPDDARRIHERRMEERREFLERETAFKRRDLDSHVNYRHKSGLLASVDAEARRMQTEGRFRDEAEQQLGPTVPAEGFELSADPDATTVSAASGDDSIARPGFAP
ncbi:MAG: type II secretion system secretin GspD [Myxococcales bacterium]|nr:type II secretion system secretin GspD [Myxococcales bacterium]